MQFLIPFEPPQTIVLQVVGSISVAPTKKEYGRPVMFKVRFILVAPVASRDFWNLRTMSYRHELARKYMVDGFRGPCAIHAGLAFESLTHPNPILNTDPR